MEFLAVQNSIFPLAVALPDKSASINGGFSFGSSNIITLKRNVQGLTVTNVATPSPAIAPSWETESVVSQNHVAWTSVRQERWEGELIVEGEIPLWLVCQSYFL
jgi:carlactone synthase/all-trans-10'-apo-beta-carotenal 13,14-cleaving dioxygenase